MASAGSDPFLNTSALTQPRGPGLTSRRMEDSLLARALEAPVDGRSLHAELLLGSSGERSITVETEALLQAHLARLARTGWELRAVHEEPAGGDGEPASVTMRFERPAA